MESVAAPPGTASVRSVERALDLLVYLEKAGQPMGVREMARLIGIPRATVQRLFSVLEKRGFVQSARGRYRLGPAVVSLAGAFMTGDSLTRAALPVMEKLTAFSGETTSLYIRQGFDRVAVQRVLSPHPLRYTLNVGRRLPLYLGASGHALAAWMPQEELDQLLAQMGEVRTVAGEVLTREGLAERLALVRQRGFALSLEERIAGVVSIAAPVMVAGQHAVAALSVTGPSSRVTREKLDSLSLEVRRSAEEVAIAYNHLM